MDRRVKTVRARLASPCTCDAQPIVRVRQIAPARPRFVLSPAFRAVAHVAYGAPRLARRRDRRAVDGVLAWVDDRPRVSRTCGVADTPLQCHDALRQRGRSELSFVDDCISQPCGKLARVRQARAHANKLRQAASRAGIAPCTLHPTAALDVSSPCCVPVGPGAPYAVHREKSLKKCAGEVSSHVSARYPMCGMSRYRQDISPRGMDVARAREGYLDSRIS